MGVAFFVLLIENFIMNVTAIAVLQCALVITRFLGVASEVVLSSLVGRRDAVPAPDRSRSEYAIACGSGRFTCELLRPAFPASLLLIAVLGFFIW